jgi:leader peptidase (prepilin peptidase)/N-methyltransferase
MKPVPIGLAALGGAALALSDLGGPPPVIARLVITGITLGAAAAIDLAEHRIPNRLVLPAAAACAVLSITAGISTAAVTCLGIVVVLLLVSLAAPSALGMGDIKLMLVVVLGLEQSALRALFFGLLLAGSAAAALVIGQGQGARRRSLPLAPFLALGSLLAIL